MINIQNFYDSDFSNEIGEGKHGKVYKYVYNNNIYALKVVIEKNDEKQNNNIENEMKIMKKIQHPNIVKCYGGYNRYIKIFKGNCYLFLLEFIKGKNLKEFLNQYMLFNENPDERLIIKMIKEIANGLKFLHQNNIIHRDISLDNIMIDDENNNIKITDFGISKIIDLSEKQKNSIVGKPIFVAPEIFNAHKNNERFAIYDTKNDIFGLGVTMFCLMTSCYPENLKCRDIIDKQNYHFAKEINSNKYSKKLINLVMSMLEEDPTKRPSCEEIIEGIEFIKNESNYYLNSEKIYSLASLTSFSTVVYCLGNIDQIYNYFVENKRNRENKKLKDELFIVIKSFIDALEISRKLNFIYNNDINKILNQISQQIIIFNEEKEDLTPKYIIRVLFNYFLTNLPEIFVYNNIIGNKLYKDREKIKENFLINQKIKEFKETYKNKLVDIFYFLVLKKYLCPLCGHLLKQQDIDIEFDIQFDNDGNISKLLKEYEKKKKYMNNYMSCPKCGLMSKYLYEIKNLYITPKVFIFHFNYYSELVEKIEIKEYMTNEIKTYNLKAFILLNKMNDNIHYEVGLKRDNNWINFNSNSSNITSFNNIINKGNICTAFYILS